MTIPVSPNQADSATIEGSLGPDHESSNDAPNLTRLRGNHSDTTELAEDLRDDTHASPHAPVHKSEDDASSESRPADTPDANDGRHKQENSNPSRGRRVKTPLQKPSIPSESPTEDDAGNDTDMEEIEFAYETCQNQIDIMEDRSLRRPLKGSEQAKLETWKQELASLKAKLPPGHILAIQSNLKMAPGSKGPSISKRLTKTKSQTSATLANRKRKKPPQQKSASAKKLKRSYGNKSKSGQSILSEMASRSTFKDRPTLDNQPDFEPIIANTVEDQLAQLRERGIKASEGDDAKIDIETKRLRQAYEYCGGHKRVQAKDGQWLITGMTTPLHSYQLDAVSWMLRRERVQSGPKGGILADEMGCGKTITALGLIHRNQPPKKDEIKATLVLVPNDQMATQWIGQVLKHCPRLSTHRFSRKRDVDPAIFGLNRVVIATYKDVERSWAHKQDTKEDFQSEDGSAGSLDKGQVLFHVTFYRLMLDECHLIKNRNSATAKAVFDMKAKHVWCISATPTPNDPDEYFPYLKVLGLEYTEDIKDYHRKWFNKAKENAAQPLESLLEEIQIRRTTDTVFMGLPIFYNVPASNYEEVTEVFCDEENILYKGIVELLRKELTKRQEELERERQAVFEQGEANCKANKGRRRRKNGKVPDTKLQVQPELPGVPAETISESAVSKLERGYFVSKIFQLRMLTAHPYMVESLFFDKGKICFPKEDIEALLSELKESNGGTESVLFKQLKRFCSAVNGGEPGGSYNMAVRSQPTEYELDRLLGITAEGMRCCSLCQQANSPKVVVAECGHQHCEEHWNMALSLGAKSQEKDNTKCLLCSRPVGRIETFDQSDRLKTQVSDLATNALEHTSHDALKNSKTKKREKKRCVGDDSNGFQPIGGRCIFLKLSDRDRHNENALPSSAKTQAIIDTVIRWQDEAPEDKIIIFTQWIMMGKIVGRLLEDRGIPFLYHFGDMTGQEKEKNLKDFESKARVKVIIMGFKCSGQGLDMPFANRAILVDPYWNEQGEEQAFARIFRKVQTKKTFFIRLVIKDSIDMRLSNIQEAKTNTITRLMKEDDPLKRYEMEAEFANLALNCTTEEGEHQSAIESVSEETDDEDGA